MTTQTTMRVALRWSDIQSMPPGRRRDQLAYSWRKKARDKHMAHVVDAETFDVLRVQAERERVLAVIQYGDTPEITRERRAILALINTTKADAA